MCYYPYFRGKQYELITIRENAPLLKQAGFVPIIEPVKESLTGLANSLKSIVQVAGKAIVIINPDIGDHSYNSESIASLLQGEFNSYNEIYFGIYLTEKHKFEFAKSIYEQCSGKSIAFIHSGFSEAKQLADLPGVIDSNVQHIFQENYCGKLYQKHFNHAKKVLLRDGFNKRINREYPEVEFFSDLHATYELENMQGFGDFLIVGDDYSETGGPAFAVAIHITFIDHDKDDEMHIFHFVSVRQDDPKDTPGKFLEALEAVFMK